MRSALISLLIFSFSLGNFARAEEKFTAPKSDLALELLVELLGGLFNFDVEKLSQAEVLEEKVLESTDAYTIRSVTIKNRDLGKVKLRIKAPTKAGVFPTLFVTPGLKSKTTPVDSWITRNDLVIVEIEYPLNEKLSGGKMVYEILRKAVKIQLQTAVAMTWIRTQPMVDVEKISFINISFGTYVAPFAIRVAQLLGLEPYSIVFVHGGSDLKTLILPVFKDAMSEADFDNVKKPLEDILDSTGPAAHLPSLQTQTGYLVVNGTKDEVIPQESKDLLVKKLPDPKDVIDLNTGHIRADSPDLNGIINTVQKWLFDQGAF